MDTVGAGGKRHSDAVVDDERHVERRQRLFDRASSFDHGAGFAELVTQLNERRAALRAQPRQVGEIVAARTLRIDNGIETKIDDHADTLVRARNVALSRPWSASMIQLAKRPGPLVFSAATSPATPSATKAAMVARQRSRSTTSAAATRAEPAQPMAVTNPISGSPLATFAECSPSVTTSVVPVSATTVSGCLAKRRGAAPAAS